jgi:hypothetical protein
MTASLDRVLAALVLAAFLVAATIAWVQDKQIQELKAEVKCVCDCGCRWDIQAQGVNVVQPLPDPECKP